jgi:hypothetical protein
LFEVAELLKPTCCEFHPKIVSSAMSVTSRLSLLYVAVLALVALVHVLCTSLPLPPLSASSGTSFSEPAVIAHVEGMGTVPALAHTAEHQAVINYVYSEAQAIAAAATGVTATATLVAVDPSTRVSDNGSSTAAYGFADLQNVVLRLEPVDYDSSAKTAPGILFNAHTDSQIASPGASDDKAGVALMLEVARAISIGAVTLEAPVEFLFNGNEELGLLGSYGYMLAKPDDMDVFINLEAMGAGGRLFLYRAAPCLVPYYLSAAQRPQLSSAVADLIVSGLVKSTTDADVFSGPIGSSGAGMIGLDFAFVQQSWVYHTVRDAVARFTAPYDASGMSTLSRYATRFLRMINPLAETDFSGSMQAAGEDLLATVAALQAVDLADVRASASNASDSTLCEATAAFSQTFGFWGNIGGFSWAVSYRATQVVAAMLVPSLFLLWALWLPARDVRTAVGSILRTFVAGLVAIVSPVAVGVATSYVAPLAWVSTQTQLIGALVYAVVALGLALPIATASAWTPQQARASRIGAASAVSLLTLALGFDWPSLLQSAGLLAAASADASSARSFLPAGIMPFLLPAAVSLHLRAWLPSRLGLSRLPPVLSALPILAFTVVFYPVTAGIIPGAGLSSPDIAPAFVAALPAVIFVLASAGTCTVFGFAPKVPQNIVLPGLVGTAAVPAPFKSAIPPSALRSSRAAALFAVEAAPTLIRGTPFTTAVPMSYFLVDEIVATQAIAGPTGTTTAVAIDENALPADTVQRRCIDPSGGSLTADLLYASLDSAALAGLEKDCSVRTEMTTTALCVPVSSPAVPSDVEFAMIAISARDASGWIDVTVTTRLGRWAIWFLNDDLAETGIDAVLPYGMSATTDGYAHIDVNSRSGHVTYFYSAADAADATDYTFSVKADAWANDLSGDYTLSVAVIASQHTLSGDLAAVKAAMPEWAQESGKYSALARQSAVTLAQVAV